jgi:hypothetical protein
LLQSPDALPRGDWELAVGGGGAVTALESDDRRAVEGPAFDVAWRAGVSDTSDVSARAFFAGDAVGIYLDVKSEVMTAPVFVSPVIGLSAAAVLSGGTTIAISPGFMVGLEEIWVAPRAVVGTSTGEGVATGFGVSVGSSLGDRLRVLPELALFYLPANFERPDLYLGFTIGVAYRRERDRSPEEELAPIEPGHGGEGWVVPDEPVEPDAGEESGSEEGSDSPLEVESDENVEVEDGVDAAASQD